MSWPRALPWIVLLLLAGLVLGGIELPGPLGGGDDDAALSPGGSAGARLQRVVDGDTIAVDIGGREERVRYIGVDTPETVKPDAPVECFGHAASALNTRLLGGEGTALTLRFDRELRDRYDRLLAYVYRASDDVFVNARLVVAGAARTLAIPPNTAHAAELSGLQHDARVAGRGLWGAC